MIRIRVNEKNLEYDIYALFKAFFPEEEINIEDQMIHVEEYAMLHGRFKFRQLLEEKSGKSYLIVTFMSVLELMKTGILKIAQDTLFGEIEIEYQKKAS